MNIHQVGKSSTEKVSVQTHQDFCLSHGD